VAWHRNRGSSCDVSHMSFLCGDDAMSLRLQVVEADIPLISRVNFFNQCYGRAK
jgi:hypothetical protein